jgi:hypothetical protein
MHTERGQSALVERAVGVLCTYRRVLSSGALCTTLT